MATMFEELQEGLQQAIDYANGKGQAKTTTYKSEPIIEYNSDRQSNPNEGLFIYKKESVRVKYLKRV